MKKTVIIGGGIAGLTAGIYLQKAGVQTEIHEKNRVPGGLCMGWKREGYLIDNCIHWLTGTGEGSALNALWKEVGALGKDVELYAKDQFFRAELNGEWLTFWRDPERTRRELLALSPEDAEEINKLMDYVKLAESMSIPVDKPFDMMSLPEFIKMGKSMGNMGKLMKEYGNMELTELAQRFKHPLITRALQEYMPPGYQAYALLVSYATVTGGNGDIPKGGSLAMVMRMAARYKELGGTLYTDSDVEQVMLRDKRAVGVLLKDGKRIDADYVVCACDTNHTFTRLLDRKYMPKQLSGFYGQPHKYPVVSAFQIAFAVDGMFEELHGTQIFSCRKLQVGSSQAERMSVSSYDYEPDFAPEGKCVIQTSFVQKEEDYRYWMELYADKDKYYGKKTETGEEARKRLVERYPLLEGKIRVLDIWTPVTYCNYTNAYHGSYMSFIITKSGKNSIVPGKIKGLENVMLASQWLMAPGGLPGAAAMGKFAAQRIMKKEKL